MEDVRGKMDDVNYTIIQELTFYAINGRCRREKYNVNYKSLLPNPLKIL